MKNVGIRFIIFIFNVFIDGFGKVGNMVFVSVMYEKMFFFGCFLDVIIFIFRIYGYCRIG